MKGDLLVVEHLNRALRHELTASSQFWLHYRLLRHWGLGGLASKWRDEAIQEMEHADRLIRRIVFLEGRPNLQDLDPLVIGETPPEVLDCDFAPSTPPGPFTAPAAKPPATPATM